MNHSTFAWCVTDSPIGPLLLAATPAGLAQVAFHTDREAAPPLLERLAARLGARPEEQAADPSPGAGAVLAEAVRQLEEYFAGRRRIFELPLDWSLCTGFNRRVLRELDATVPFGAVAGYGELAERVGEPGASQAVGRAMGANPLPVVVACHRVVESDGGLGGFGGGLETKRRLLALEGVLPEPLF
ncbi:methylated-DNA--[protein]-cysteine S-methyltransferase [Streptomyces polyrhachis]|uniref:Methylated-DNA--protein-cysteine methyltransferase n=1 Tax=Streptomyces polyrhachis TaxID=1282885 RepID=A0ABW2GD22_9ACTN